MKKFLQKDELHLVNPKFQELVKKAWDNNEKVPHSVIYLSDAPLTQKDIEYGKYLAEKYTDLINECKKP